MNEQPKSLAKTLKERSSISPTEHIQNVIKAGLATAPFCGGIASLMNDYIPSSKHNRLERFAKKIASDLETLQQQIKEQNILTDEFAYTFEKCFRGAAEHYQREKLDAFRGILVNSALGSKLPAEEKDYFLNLVGTLSALHICILKFMASPLNYLRENGIPQEKIRGGFSQFFPTAIAGVHIEVIKSAYGDLYHYGFFNTDKQIFTTMTSGQGLDLLENGERVTDLGKRFIAFCTSPCD